MTKPGLQRSGTDGNDILSMFKKLIVLLFLLFLFEPAFSAEYMICTKCDPAPNNGIKPNEQLQAGDIVKEIIGLKPTGDIAFFEKWQKAVKNLKRYHCQVLRNGQEITVYYSSSDYTDWASIDDSPTTVSAEDITIDLNDLFYFLEQVYILSDKTNDTGYRRSKEELLDYFFGKDCYNLDDVYLELASFLTRFEDGHLRIGYRNLVTELMKNWYLRDQGTFPLEIQTYRRNFYIRVPTGTRETIVRLLSINGHPIEDIVTDMKTRIGGDSVEHKDSYILDNFPILYSWIFGYSPEYVISFKDGRHTKQTTVSAGAPAHLLREPYGIGSWTIKDNVGILTINGFNNDESFESLVQSFFDHVRKEQIPAVVIDIRENKGGNSQSLTFLMLFVEERPFTIYERYQYRQPNEQKDQENKRTWYGPNIGERVITSDKYTISGAPIYKGPIYLLTSARNYSTALDCIIALKNRGNTTIIGQKCGGKLISTGNTMTWIGTKTGVHVMFPVSLYYPLNYREYLEKDSLEPDIFMENMPFTRRDSILDKALKMGNKTQ